MTPTAGHAAARPWRLAVAAAVAITGIALALGVTGCSSSEQDRPHYAVPTDVCGVPMPSPVLEPLLPSGKKITSQAKDTGGLHACKVLVDGRVSVSAAVERWEHGTTFQKVMAATPGLEEQHHDDDHAPSAVSDTTGLSRVRCSASKNTAGEEVFATIRAENSSPGADALRKAVTAYADGAADTKACRS
ncbi:hypothetical protein AB0J38_42875 [Streptomyces sp. NPDC050095]|uniref:hypothetical protein n=1 Tax=unclassified Streptomyces TaxID=2593676 RepID=UPI00342ACC86